MFIAQNAVEDAVEGAHPQAGSLFRPHLQGDALLHFLGGFVGEGQSQDVLRCHPLLHQPRDFIGEHTGLAAARTGNHQRGSVATDHGALLRGIQFFQIHHTIPTNISHGHRRKP